MNKQGVINYFFGSVANGETDRMVNWNPSRPKEWDPDLLCSGGKLVLARKGGGKPWRDEKKDLDNENKCATCGKGVGPMV